MRRVSLSCFERLLVRRETHNVRFIR
ncbi:hypothetical protein RHCRD62_90024 [Rhodococcus sp. RD6.2]|nr:hypothetical protein RHCRD62_90024 [Rhodococcus sp. RD6.2]